MLNNQEFIASLCNADMCNANEQLQELRECVSVEEAERMQRIAETNK